MKNDPAEASSDPAVHQARIRLELEKLIEHARADATRVNDPGFQALLETAVEVLAGLKNAVENYDAKRESDSRDSDASSR